MKKMFFFLCSVMVLNADAQKLKKEDRAILASLQQHVQFLADDKLEGRRTGTTGEKLAAHYISEAFGKAGLQPRGKEGWFQEFSISEGRKVDENTSLSIDGEVLQLHKDFFPLAFSSNNAVEASPSLALEEKGMPWFLDLKELMDANASNPHFDMSASIAQKAKEIHTRGGNALILFNSSSRADGLKFDARDRSTTAPIPVIYVQHEAAKKHFSDVSATLDMAFNVSTSEISRTGTNVIGYLNMNAPNTIVVGAHFDHLGYGEDGNSRETGVKAIHNGADDNASGTAAIIELAAMVRKGKLKNHNFLFIAFSGEELGLFGSKYFTENPTIDLASVSYMINLDMVGRLNDSSTLTVGGYGTSPTWGKFYNEKGKNRLYADGLAFRFDSSGTGPSDHTSFYRKDIPVLFYFTGLHSDYHKPTDDADKINYYGQLNLVKHVYSLVQKTDKENQRLSFLKTREAQTTTTARFSVSLGIMPDYSFSGAGVRVDGVTEGRPAQKAGLKAGDIVTALGNYSINSMESYMQSLSKFKKGDKAIIKYTRAGQVVSTEVEF
jgi:aminopeptidase YwaD